MSRVTHEKTTRPLVLKLGGELVEDSVNLPIVVSAVAAIHASERHLVLIHGGGKEIDSALKRAGIEKHQVDGLRITDEPTLAIAVSVLAGTVNTRFVAALNAAGVAAVGLTGADARCAPADLAPPHRTADGRTVDLGRVGLPANDADPALFSTLLAGGFVPVLACIGVDRDGRLLNVNADTLAGHVAARLNARRLIVAGTTRGVIASDGRTLEVLAASDVAGLVGDGTANAGMIAKLRACEHALAHGVDDVMIVDGRDRSALVSAASGGASAGTILRVTKEIAGARLS